MALNRFMHIQNPYRHTRPDFFALRDKYPEFRDVTRIDDTETGTVVTDLGSCGTVKRTETKQKVRVELNFKDPQAVAVLTRVLLLENFQLNVAIPRNSLVPALPLRLNYLCWLKEVLDKFASSYSNVSAVQFDQIVGIDIGCGPTCIYAILGRKLFGWRFVASEVQHVYATAAQENLRNNGLSDYISVYAVDAGSYLSDLVHKHESDQNTWQRFHFAVCNPPFFECEQDSYESHNFREGEDDMQTDTQESTPAMESTSDGKRIAKQCTGGEVQFVKRLIDDSLKLRTRVLVYSTMLGLKSSVKPLKQYLLANGVRHHSAYELCQGSKMRYVIAWTFVCDDASQELSVPFETPFQVPVQHQPLWTTTEPIDWPISEFRRHKFACRRDKPIEWRLPADRFASSNVEEVLQSVKFHFAQLEIEILREKRRTTSRKLNEKVSHLHVAPQFGDGEVPLSNSSIAKPGFEHLSLEHELKFRAYMPTWQNQRRKRRMLLGKTKASEHESAAHATIPSANNETHGQSAILQARCIIIGPVVGACTSMSTSTTVDVDVDRLLMQFFLLDSTNKNHLFQLVQYLKNNLQMRDKCALDTAY